MKKLKSLLALLLLLCFLPIIPTASAGASDIDISIPNKAELAAVLGVSESDFDGIITSAFSAIENHDTSCNLSFYRIRYSTDVYMALYDCIVGNPEFFHIDSMTVYYSQLGFITRLEFKYIYSEQLYSAMLSECRLAASELTKGITADMSDIEKALLIHDRLALYCEYDYENLLNNTLPFDSYTLYGALGKRISVCQGYARAMEYLLDSVGVPSYTCSSDGLNHIWTIAYIDGEKYHIDTTWDDPVADLYGRVLHTNFLLSTNALKVSVPSPHNTSDYDTSPVATTYDNAFWQASQSAFCLLGGSYYYIDHDNEAICEYDFATDTSTELLALDGYWAAGANSYWRGNFSRLATDGKLLYYSLNDGIYSFDPKTNATHTVFLPDMSAHDFFSIYGFKLEGNTLICQAYATPNIDLNTETEVYTHTLKTRLLGDLTDDGIITVADALFLLRASAKLVTLDSVTLAYADMDSDGKITVADALAVLTIAVNR